MKVSINQPAFLPWTGFFERIAISDLHIKLDHVQFEKNSLTNRNRIKGANGPIWLTVPVKTSGKFQNNSIKELEIVSAEDWKKKHIKSIEMSYRKAKYFNDVFPMIQSIYEKPWDLLNPLLDESTSKIINYLKIETKIISSSDLSVESKKADLVLNLCKKVGANEYISGPFGRDYLDLETFKNAGIRVRFHQHQYPTYQQLYGDFTKDLSVIDLMFNEGPHAAEIYKSEKIDNCLLDE